MSDLKIEIEKGKLKNYLKNSKKIILINHKRIDGDAFGSLGAFYYVLKKIGDYEIISVNEEKTPETLKFLNDEEIFQTINFTEFNPDLIISFDVASIEQMGDVYKNNVDFFLNTTWINIDHHISNSFFGNINIIDFEASSTCEIIWEIIKNFDLQKYVDEKIATFLLTGIITDTNNFLNTNVNAKTLLVASEIMNYKPRHKDIILNLFKKNSYNKIKLWGKILESLKDIKNSAIVWNIIPKSLFVQTQTTNKDISGFIDEFLTTIDGLKVGFLLYELDNNTIKGSFRSKTDEINLNDFCYKWGGGGHSKASGFIVEGKNLYEIEQEVIEEFKKILTIN